MTELKKIAEKIKVFFLEILKKMHIIKDQNPYYKKAMDFLTKYIGTPCKKAWANYKTIPKGTRAAIAAVLILAVLGGTAGAIWHYNKRKIVKAWKNYGKEQTINKENKILLDGKPIKTGKINDTLTMGHLDILVNSIKSGSFQSFELDDRGRRIAKDYTGIGLHVFNFSSDKTEKLIIGLRDEKGALHRIDESIPFYIGDIREFGRNMYMYPRIIQDGHVFFSGIDPGIKKLTLIVGIEETKETIAFELER